MTYLDFPLSGFRFPAFWDETSNILKRKDLCDRKRKTAEKLSGGNVCKNGPGVSFIKLSPKSINSKFLNYWT